MSKGFASTYRIWVLAFCVMACFGGIATRLVYLHVIDRAKLVRYIDKARRQIIVEHARRGDILDTRGDILATSRSVVELGVDPQMLRREDEAKWPELAKLIGKSVDELRTVFRTKVRPAQASDFSDADREIRWAKISEEIAESTYEKVTALGIKGVYGNRIYRRIYPHNRLAAHMVGYVNWEGQSASGVENYADFYLRGQNGWRESEKDGRQREQAQFISREARATHGYSVVLSIDSVIQSWVEVELEEIAKKFNPQKAAIIVSDAKTGFILALGNYPTFNLNEFNKAPMEVQKTFAVADQIDPGSTFKIVAAAGALNDNLVRLETPFDCMREVVDYNGRRVRLLRDDHNYDHPLTVAEIISHSSNRGAAQLAMKLGDERFYKYACEFGFGQLTGFPFGGEINGELNPPKKWSGVDIASIPTGYSVSATPLQVHYAMAAIASGGELLRPQIIREIRDSRGETVYTFNRFVRRRVITPETAEQMAVALHGVVTDGTGKSANLPGYLIAGKTGTAQKLMPDPETKRMGYSKQNHVGSFVGFFPASRPRVVISVIVDDGKVPNGAHGGAGYGSAVAAPSFKHVAQKLIQYMDIQPDAELNRPVLVAEGGR